MFKNTITRIQDSKYFLAIGAITCSVLWGSAFPAIRVAHQYFDSAPLMNHIAFAGLRFTLAGFLVLMFTKKNWQNWQDCPKAGLLLVMLFQVVFQYTLFYWGMKMAPAVLGAILISTGSFWWVILAPLVDKKESLNLKQFLLIALGFAGVCICLMNKYSTTGMQNLYGLLFVASCLCGIIAALLVRPMSKKVPAPFLAGVSLFSGGLILCLITYQESLSMVQNMSWPLGALTVWLAIVSSAAFSLWYYLITLFDVPRLSGYRMMIPLFGVLESVIFLKDEKLTINLLIGGTVILVSVAMLEKLKKKAA
jgi:drug/metabolite transporter (DMT)-like permease